MQRIRSLTQVVPFFVMGIIGIMMALRVSFVNAALLWTLSFVVMLVLGVAFSFVLYLASNETDKLKIKQQNQELMTKLKNFFTRR